MGLCVSRALEELKELDEEGEEQEEQECSRRRRRSSSLQKIVMESGGGGGGCCSSSSNNSVNSLIKALSFDSSRSSAEVGDMGKLGALFCKRRPFVGSPDILSAHLTNLLSSIVRTSTEDHQLQQQQREVVVVAKSPAEISFSSYLNKPFIRQTQGFFQQHATDAANAASLDAIAKSYAESAAKAAARDTYLFLKENDTSLHSFFDGTSRALSGPDDHHHQLRRGRGLRSHSALASCVPEEDDNIFTFEEEEEEEEEEEPEITHVAAAAATETTSSDDDSSDPGSPVDLFRPGSMYQEQNELVADVAAATPYTTTEQRSLFDHFCFPATTTSSRWASVVNAARQSACLATRPLQQIPAQTTLKWKKQQQGTSQAGDVQEQQLEGKKNSNKNNKKLTVTAEAISGLQKGLGKGRSVAAPVNLKKAHDADDDDDDARARGGRGATSSPIQSQDFPLQDVAYRSSSSSKVDRNLGCRKESDAAAAGAKVHLPSDDEDSRNQRCLALCPPSRSSCCCVQIRIPPGKKCSEDPCHSNSSSSGSSMSDSATLEDHHQAAELEEAAQDSDPDRDSFFSFPSSPSSKLFEEMGSGHIIEQMKFTKLMQEMACRRKIVEEFQAGILRFENPGRRSYEQAESLLPSPPPPPCSQLSGNGFQGSECSAIQQLTHEKDSRAAALPPPLMQQQPSFDNNQNLNLFAISAADVSNRFADLESLANTEDDDDDDDHGNEDDNDSSDTNPREYGEHDGDEESSCESFDIDDHAQGIKIMSFMGKDFACLQIKKCFHANHEAADFMISGTAVQQSVSEQLSSGIFRNLIHGSGKGVRKVSTRPKSVKQDAPPPDIRNNKAKNLEQFEDSKTTTTTTLSSTVKGLVLRKCGLLCRNHLAVKTDKDDNDNDDIAHKSISP